MRIFLACRGAMAFALAMKNTVSEPRQGRSKILSLETKQRRQQTFEGFVNVAFGFLKFGYSLQLDLLDDDLADFHPHRHLLRRSHHAATWPPQCRNSERTTLKYPVAL